MWIQTPQGWHKIEDTTMNQDTSNIVDAVAEKVHAERDKASYQFTTKNGVAALLALVMALYTGYQQWQTSQGKAVDPQITALVNAMQGAGAVKPSPITPAPVDDTKARLDKIEKALDILLGKKAPITQEVSFTAEEDLVSRAIKYQQAQDFSARIKAAEDAAAGAIAAANSANATAARLRGDVSVLTERVAIAEEKSDAAIKASKAKFQPSAVDAWGRGTAAVILQDESPAAAGSCANGACSTGSGRGLFFRRR